MTPEYYIVENARMRQNMEDRSGTLPLSSQILHVMRDNRWRNNCDIARKLNMTAQTVANATKIAAERGLLIMEGGPKTLRFRLAPTRKAEVPRKGSVREKISAIVEESPGATVLEIAQAMNRTRKQVSNEIIVMHRLGMLTRTGSGRQGNAYCYFPVSQH
ncbi:MAG: hypothetical protein MJH10_10240 [Epibacterium sp.]|nr:hypothetical protein [Epibacterium sp.]NQX73918.1 hypothetical protein [Epibacterium sp.]